MPRPKPTVHHADCLWRTGARRFFKDQRARDVGDILTVLVQIDDEATVENSTTRVRDNAEDAPIGKFFGVEGEFDEFLPDAVDPTNLVDIESDSEVEGAGEIERDEEITMRVAAIDT